MSLSLGCSVGIADRPEQKNGNNVHHVAASRTANETYRDVIRAWTGSRLRERKRREKGIGGRPTMPLSRRDQPTYLEDQRATAFSSGSCALLWNSKHREAPCVDAAAHSFRVLRESAADIGLCCVDMRQISAVSGRARWPSLMIQALLVVFSV